MVVGIIATESQGHLKQLAPWPLVRPRIFPRRMWTRYSEGLAVTKPQRLVFSGSSIGLPLRQPLSGRPHVSWCTARTAERTTWSVISCVIFVAIACLLAMGSWPSASPLSKARA